MRKLAAALFLLAGALSVSADPAADVARMLVRDVRPQALVATAMISSRDAVERLAESDDPVVISATMDRVMRLFDAHFRSPAFERDVVTPWLSATFTNAELMEIAAFGNTPAGRKFIGTWPGLAQQLVMRSMNLLQADLATEVLGSREKGEEAARMARVRRTEADMSALTTALGAFATDRNHFPAATDMESLRPHLSPVYIRTMPSRDAWGRRFTYSSGAEGREYRLASAGPDGIPENDDDIVLTHGAGGEAVAAPLAGGAGPYRVGGDVRAPTLVRRVEPVMTAEAKRAGVSGIVIVEAVIDANGNVSDVRVLKPLPFGLDEAAVDAVRQWHFKPATLHGAPVPVLFNLTVNFIAKE